MKLLSLNGKRLNHPAVCDSTPPRRGITRALAWAVTLCMVFMLLPTVTVSASGEPSATISDVTISGAKGVAISGTAAITVSGVLASNGNASTLGNVNAWFTNPPLPAGINVTAESNGSSTITFFFSGTPEATSTAAFGTITIPGAELNDGFGAPPLVVTHNPDAKFNIGLSWNSTTVPTVEDGDLVVIANGARGIMDVPDGATVTINGTAASAATTWGSGITFNIGTNATIIWNASYTYNDTSAWGTTAITVNGSGTFLMEGGLIRSQGDSGQGSHGLRLYNSIKAVITAGEVRGATGSVHTSGDSVAAIRNTVTTNGSLNASGNSVIFTYTQGTYDALDDTNITVSGGGSAVWSKGASNGTGAGNGIWFQRNTNSGFIALSGVTVNAPPWGADTIPWHNATTPVFEDGDTITIFDGALGTLNVPASTTVTITGTAATTFSGALGIELLIGNNSTVIWEADYTYTSLAPSNDAINIGGSGTFLMTGGKIEAVGSNPCAIFIFNSARAVITGGKLIATGGFAVVAASNSMAAISTAVEITENFEANSNTVIFTYTNGTYDALSNTNITVSGDGSAVWSKGAVNGTGAGNGIWFQRNTNSGFIALSGITVAPPFVPVSSSSSGGWAWTPPSPEPTPDPTEDTGTENPDTPPPFDFNVENWTNIFADLNPAHPYFEALAFMNLNGLMVGYGNGNVGADDTLTRAQFATLLWNLEGQPAPNGTATFDDVEDGAWYNNPVAWAAEMDVVAGKGDENFDPYAPITRQEIIQMLYNFAVNFKGLELPADFPMPDYTDADQLDYWAESAANALAEAGVLPDSDELRPSDDATRGEMADMFMRFVRFVVGEY
jgi:hypothetical protein